MTMYTIRALEWQDMLRVVCSRADTAIGCITAGACEDGSFGWQSENLLKKGFANIAAAKAAAEAHYHEKILTALEVVG